MDQESRQHFRGQLFRHVDGGFYRFDRLVSSSEDKSQKVVYDHVWPFEVGGWERPIAEWLKNFKPVSEKELDLSMARDVAVVRQEVTDRKAARRACRKV